MTNDEGSTNAGMTKQHSECELRHSDFVIPSSFVATGPALAALLEQIEPASRVAVDTEADSLHSYREKLCLLQLSVSGRDHIVDPLADMDFARLRDALGPKEIVLHGADYDLRMLRRGINFTARKIFDTVIAARLLGIREFSLAALVRTYFDVELPKGSQKANWAKRPLPKRMAEYALNDVHYLLRLADRLEAELDRHHRLDWFRQSCQRAIEQAAADRVRDEDEVWRIRGGGRVTWPRGGGLTRALAMARSRSRGGGSSRLPYFAKRRAAPLGRSICRRVGPGLPPFLRAPPPRLSRGRGKSVAIARERMAGLAAEIWDATDERNGAPDRSITPTSRSRRAHSKNGTRLHRAARRPGSHRHRAGPRRNAPRPVATRAARRVADRENLDRRRAVDPKRRPKAEI